MPTYTTQKMKEFRKPKPRLPILPAIRERFSPRWFSPEPIPEKDVDRMLEAARWAPSGYNSQPWYFYWTTQGTKAFADIQSCLPDFNLWSATAPILIVACYLDRDKVGKNRFAKYDLGASVVSLILQATNMGYYARQMGIFKKAKLIKLLKIDSLHTPFVILALGKLGDYTKIDDALLERELSPHERKRDLAKRLK
jgi:nitroreductase